MAFLSDIRLTKQGKIVFSLIGLALVLIPAVLYSLQLKEQRREELSFLEQVTSPEAEQEALSIEEQVGRLIELPKGEVPSLATVDNAASLRDQEFYRNAQDGDRVLIYQQAHMAYLYRPSTGKLINVMPAVFEEEEKQRQREALVASASDAAELATPAAEVLLEPNVAN